MSLRLLSSYRVQIESVRTGHIRTVYEGEHQAVDGGNAIEQALRQFRNWGDFHPEATIVVTATPLEPGPNLSPEEDTAT